MGKYARIIDPPTKDNEGGVIPFAKWPSTLVLADAVQKFDLISVLKSRQVSASLTLVTWQEYGALFKDGWKGFFFSKGENESIELITKAHNMYDQLPGFMRLRLNPDSRSELGFPDRHSTLKAFPATEDAGISFTASSILMDEAEYMEYANWLYTNAKPVIDGGGQLIMLFTVDKRKPKTLAKSIFIEAYESRQKNHPICDTVKNMIYPVGPSKNGFVPIFLPYWVRPGRDEAWYERTMASIPKKELEGLTPELYMQQNYPRSVEEALRPTQTAAAVDLKVLDEMKKRCTAPVRVDGLDPLICKVWKPYQVGKAYVAASDTSHGVGKDYNVTCVMDVRTGEIVADVFNNTMKPDEFALYSVELLKSFRHPKWFIEDNDWGATTIDNAKKLNYPNFGYQDAQRTKIGWHTGNSNRTTLFANMITAFNTWGVTISNYEGLLQFGYLVRNMEKDGRIEAMKGENDDYPTVVAICVAKSEEVLKSASFSCTPIKTLHFAGARR